MVTGGATFEPLGMSCDWFSKTRDFTTALLRLPQSNPAGDSLNWAEQANQAHTALFFQVIDIMNKDV